MVDALILERRLVQQDDVGPILSDGTPLSDLFDLENKEVSMRLLSDPEVYEIELKRLFARMWNFVAHESEVPNPGDFVLRYIGADPVIVIRQRDGEIKVLLNVCTHRGMQVCREDAGNAVKFRCPYHGWVFNRDGTFLSAPYEKEMYSGDVLKKDRLALTPARVGVFAGLVFATWDQEADTLDEWLGEYGDYIRMMFDRTEKGLEVTGPPQRFIMQANWKCAGEQANTDGYHGPTLHESLMVLNVRPGGAQKKSESVGSIGVDVSCWQGHGIRCVDRNVYSPMVGADLGSLPAEESLSLMPPPGVPKELLPEVLERFSPDHLKIMSTFPPTVGGMFPNIGLLCLYAGDPVKGGVGPGVGLHAFVPTGPNTFEMMHWNLVEKGATDEYKAWANSTATFALGSTGVFEMDDAEAWAGQQRAAKGVMGGKVTLKYNSLMGVNKPDDWGAGGLVYAGFSKDDSQWNWWMRYRDFMMGSPWQ